MRITIEEIGGGVLPHARRQGRIAVVSDEMPDDLRERITHWLSSRQLAEYAAKTANVGAADQRQIEFGFRNEDAIERFVINESVCDPGFLDLLDELFGMHAV